MSDKPLRDTPYQGLVPYSEDDEQFFFGRKSERDIITGNLMASRLTLLYGPSGVGKSSVLRAGVAAYVRQQSREHLLAKNVPRFVLVIFRDWKDDPLAELLKQVRSSVTDSFRGKPFEPVPSGLSFGDELKQWADRIGGKLLIVLDQFEEYFLYPEKKNGTSFAVQFPDAVNSSDLRVNFLISIREDWLAKLDRFKVDVPSLFDNYLRMDGLDREAARDAIEQPVARYNEIRQADEPEIVVHKDFAGKVLDQLEKLANKNVLAESGSGQVKDDGESARVKTRIQPPYLQLVMVHLWRQAVASSDHELHPKMLDDPNMAETIIQSHLEEVMKNLDDGEREAASKVFSHLVTPSGIKIAQSLPDLAAFAHLSQTQIVPMLAKLSSKESGILTQLVPPPGQPTQPRYEIYHDVLAPAVVRWCNAYKSAEELREAQERAEQDRIIAMQQAQIAARLRRLSVALTVITVLAVLFAIFGFSQFTIAQAQKVENAKQEKDLTEAKTNIEELTRRSEKARGDAEEAILKANGEETKARAAERASQIAAANANKAFALAKEEKRKADASNLEAANAKSRAAASDLAAADANSKAAASNLEATKAKKRAEEYGHAIDLSREAALLYLAKDLKEALGKYGELLKVYQQLGDLNGQADTYFQMGGIAASLPIEMGTTHQPAEYYKHALELYRQTKNLRSEADTLIASLPLYQPEKGLEILESLIDALDLYRQLGDKNKFNETLTALQPVNLQQYQIDARKELDSRYKLLEIFSKSADLFENPVVVEPGVDKPVVVNQTATLERIGELHFQLHDTAKALESYRVASELSDNSYRSKMVGDLHYQLNDKQKALAAYLKSASLLKSAPYNPLADEGIILVSIADVYRQSNNKDKAIEFYRRLQEIQFWRCVALLRVAEIYRGLNDKQSVLDQYLQIVLPAGQNQYCSTTVTSGEFAGPGPIVPLVEKTPKQFEVELLTSISSLYRELGNKDKSEEYAELAEERQKRPF